MSKISELIDREISKWHNDGDNNWELCDVRDFAFVIANQVVSECIDSIQQESDISKLQLVKNSEMFAMGLVAANGVIKKRFGL